MQDLALRTRRVSSFVLPFQGKRKRKEGNQQPAGRLNIVPGIILHASFVGGRWRTLVKYGEKQEHTVLAFATTQPTLNAKVWLELPPELCQIVPA
jgi:hypothetical protein